MEGFFIEGKQPENESIRPNPAAVPVFGGVGEACDLEICQSEDPKDEIEGSDDESEGSEDELREPFRFLDLPTEIQIQMVCRYFNELMRRGHVMSSFRDHYVSIIADYYKFLTSLHIPEEDVIYPPSTGWANITVESCRGWGKTAFVIDFLRHLPYIRESRDPNHSAHQQDCFNCINYKCNVVDYSTWTSGEEHPGTCGELCFGEEYEADEDISLWKHRAIIADGCESGGVIIVLDTLSGKIFERIIRYGDSGPWPVDEYFEQAKESLRDCKMVFVPGREPLELEGVDMRLFENAGDREEPSRPGEDFGYTYDLVDYYWVRHLYFKHGWPVRDWKKDKCLEAVREYCVKREAEA